MSYVLSLTPMKALLTTIITTISLSSFAQQWTEYKVDSVLTVTIPDNYEVQDTLGQRIIMAQVDYGAVMISVLPNTGRDINVRNQQELIDTYKQMREGFIESQNGQLIEEQVIDNGALKLIRFSFRATMGDEKQIRHCVTAFVNKKTYTVNFWEVESMTDEMTADREKLFSSIKFPVGFSMANQLSAAKEGSLAYNIGYIIGKILFYVLLIGLVTILVRWISKRSKRKDANAQQ